MSTRPEHKPAGDPCSRCGEAAHRHRQRKRPYRETRHSRKRVVIGIDGEGYTAPDGSHRYSYLAACKQHRLVAEVSNPTGITSQQVLELLWALPKSALLVGFSLGYDRTKWFEDWPDHSIYQLTHAEHYQRKFGPSPAKHNGWRVSLVSTRLTLRRDGKDRRGVSVWDVFKFFQCSFVTALEKWQIGTVEQRARIAADKARRGSFSEIGPGEQLYCQTECKLLATLVHELLDAHDQEGLKLRSYFGPGSTASVILHEWGDQRAHVPKPMQHAVACAYFGGRFECSRVGPLQAKQLYSYDIASAYPHAMTMIPCLLHGRWRYTSEPDLGTLPLASVIRFEVNEHAHANPAWGPLPHRLKDGNIVFPIKSAGGWAWRDELLAARRIHPGVIPLAAWYWEATCVCPLPFAERIRELYERRLHWGKAARGIVLKLALNSLYGKSAQRVGRGKYKCMVRAGLITSITRAKLLHAISLAGNPWDILDVATDSILSRTPLPLEAPGLGGWERKPWQGGAFLMRPGLRFALESGESETKHTAARGVGVSTLHKNRARVRAQWQCDPMSSITLDTPSFFVGARLGIRRLVRDSDMDQVTYEFRRDAQYGRWHADTRTLSYAPGPKRSHLLDCYKLAPWQLRQREQDASCPYDGQMSITGDALELMRELEADQDDIGALTLL